MSLWDKLADLVAGPEMVREQEERGSIRHQVRELRASRRRADTAIDELQARAERAIRESGRTPAAAIRAARDELHRTVGNGSHI